MKKTIPITIIFALILNEALSKSGRIPSENSKENSGMTANLDHFGRHGKEFGVLAPSIKNISQGGEVKNYHEHEHKRVMNKSDLQPNNKRVNVLPRNQISDLSTKLPTETKDFNLMEPGDTGDRSKRAFYESFVYNPNNVYNSESAFTRSDSMNTPESKVSDEIQNQAHLNRLGSTFIQHKNPPVQTPTNQIGYQSPSSENNRASYQPKIISQNLFPRHNIFQKPGAVDNQDINEEYPLENDKHKQILFPMKSQVNLEGPENIYGDVLSNIEYVQSKEELGYSKPSDGFRRRHPSLDAQFELHSYKNLQHNENDNAKERDDEYIDESYSQNVDDKDELEEYEDGAESKEVPEKKEIRTSKNKPKTSGSQTSRTTAKHIVEKPGAHETSSKVYSEFNSWPTIPKRGQKPWPHLIQRVQPKNTWKQMFPMIEESRKGTYE